MKIRMMLFAATMAVVIPVQVISLPDDSSVGTNPDWLAKPDFWIANAANLASIGLFVARVHAPNLAEPLGYLTEAIGAPALAFAISDIATNKVDATTFGLFSYAAWAAGAALVDHVLQLEYRDPRNNFILVPYVVLYYTGSGILSATQLDNGKTPWIISGIGCVLTVAASFYARARGAD